MANVNRIVLLDSGGDEELFSGKSVLSEPPPLFETPAMDEMATYSDDTPRDASFLSSRPPAWAWVDS